MENVTLGWINQNVGFIIALFGGLFAVYSALKKVFDKGMLEPITKQIMDLEKSLIKEIRKVDMNTTKNFLIDKIQEVENGIKLDPVTLERFWEEYEHYVKDLDGNSYIEKRVENLQKKKKI